MSDEPEPDHYFRDSSGDMWVNMSAVKQNLDLVPLGGGEVSLEVADVMVAKDNPAMSLLLTAEGHRQLGEIQFNDYDWEMESDT